MSQQRDFPLCLPSPLASRRRRSGWLQFFRSGTFVQAVLSTSSISTSMFRPLRSTVVTRFSATMSPSDSRQEPLTSYLFPMAVLAPGGSPRFLDRSFHARCPLSPRAARQLPSPIASLPVLASSLSGGLATAICVTRPIRVRVLSLRLACSPRKASPAELLPPSLARLLAQRAIDKISSFQNIRSARLFLALRRHEEHEGRDLTSEPS